MSEQKFARGIYFDKPREGAPDFVRGRLSIKVDDAIEYLKEVRNDKGYANFDLLKSKDGSKLYFTLNEWKPEVKQEDYGNIPETGIPYPTGRETNAGGANQITPDDIPF